MAFKAFTFRVFKFRILTALLIKNKLSRDSSVSIVFGLRTGSPSFDSRQERTRASFSVPPRPNHPTSYPIGTGGCFPNGKAAGA
jgi:hypothetical protein